MTVIRDAVIRIRTERAGSSGPGSGFESRAFAQEARAAGEAAKEIKRSNEQVREHRRSLEESTIQVDRFGHRSIKAFGEAGNAALNLTRGFALLASSTEEDTQKLIQSLVTIEATVSAIRGVAGLAKFAAAFGPVGVAVAGVTALAAAGTVAWQRWGRAGAEAADTITEKLKTTTRALADVEARVARANAAASGRRLAPSEFAVGSAVTASARREALGRQSVAIDSEIIKTRQERKLFEDTIAQGVQPADLPAYKTRVLETQKTEQDLIRQRVSVERDLLDLLKEERLEALQRQNDAARNVGGLFGGKATDFAIRANEVGAQRDITALEANTQQSVNRLVNVFEQLNQGISKLEKDLQSLQR